MTYRLQRWVLPVVVSALAAGCSGGGSGTSVPVTQPPGPGNATSSQTPRYFNPATAVSPDFFICIPGVTTKNTSCASPTKQPTQWVEVVSASFGVEEPISVSSSGVTTGSSSLTDLNILKYADSTTPLAQLLLYSGTPVSGDARLVETRTDANGTLPFTEVDLKSAKVTSDQMSAGSGGGVIESVSLSMTAMQYAYQPLLSSGLTGPVFKKNWDTVTRVADYAPSTVLPAAGIPGLVPALVPAALRTSSSMRRIAIPDGLVRALATKANLPVSKINTVLNGSLTQLLTLPGFKGTSTEPGYPNATNMLGFAVGAENTGGAPFAEAASMDQLVDVNATSLWGLIASSAPFSGPQAELDLVDFTVSPGEKLAYFQFGTPYPESYSFSGSAGGSSVESIAIFYAQIKFCVVPYTAGVAGSPVCQSWNFITNQPT